ncbi:MAG: zinc-finger domain-containing protein [Proteobacteria bacterium]|nr:zinc-finger domain-containing protein [Pseudomonadota bacterium]
MAESITVHEKEVMCDGTTNNQPPSHPRVYLHVQDDNRIECPYCRKIFIYDDAH